jgi:signal transduction histidine kinase
LAAKQLYPAVIIEYHFKDPSPRLAVARPALYQVFFQLLQHAVQSATGDRPPRIEVGGQEQAGHVEFWVADNGRGFSEAETRQLFEPFAQGAWADAGTALGLFLVSQVVSAWGGSLSAESTPGKGATFRIRV